MLGDKLTTILCVAVSQELQEALTEYIYENCIEGYVIKSIEFEQYMKVLGNDKIEDNIIVIFSAHIFSSLNELKKFKMAKYKHILVTEKESASFIEKAQIKGFDIYYAKSPIDTLMYKITNSYQVYKETFKYKGVSELPKEERGKIITVYSPKGGTGKTTIAVNIAIKYAQKGLKTLLIDLSQYSFVMRLFDKEQKVGGLSTVLSQLEKGIVEIQDILHENIRHYEIEKIGIDVLASSQPLKMDQFNGEKTQLLLRELRHLEYDVIVIDTSSDLSIRNIVAFELSDYIALITNSDVFAGLSLIQLKEVLNSLGLVNKCKLIVNDFDEAVEFSYYDLENELQIPTVGVIPSCKEIKYLNNMGKVLGLIPKHKMNTYYNQVAHAFIPIFSKSEVQVKRFFFR